MRPTRTSPWPAAAIGIGPRFWCGRTTFTPGACAMIGRTCSSLIGFSHSKLMGAQHGYADAGHTSHDYPVREDLESWQLRLTRVNFRNLFLRSGAGPAGDPLSCAYHALDAILLVR